MVGKHDKCGVNAGSVTRERWCRARGRVQRRQQAGAGDAHRLIAIAQAKLGNARAANEHIVEAQRLTEIHGTPYAVLRTLIAKATILNSAPLRLEAIEFARLLLKLGKETESAG